MKFNPTLKQTEAFNHVIKAIKKAEKTGIRFFGKSDVLVAYRKEAVEYFSEKKDMEKSMQTEYSEIQHCFASVLVDSGADDYPCYFSEDDEVKYG